MSRVQAGALLIIVVTVISYLGFTKAIPFRHHWEMKADFKTSNNLRTNSLVRIAGVNVGKVSAVEPREAGKPGVRVTFRINEEGRPIHKDATIALKPRIFLEGNLFVDIHPGTPTAPIVKDGDVIAEGNNVTPVQLDQVLTSLQADTRRDLVRLLDELSTSLSGRGGRGYNRSIQYWEPAFRGAAIVNDASLGIEPHDLSGYLNQAGRFADALDRNPPALKSLITDFNTTARAFAAERVALQSTLSELPRTLRIARPALRTLNASFPAVRRLTADLRPATRSTGPTIDASLPFIAQLRLLVGPQELQGLTGDLEELTPDVAKLNDQLPHLFKEVALASSCQNEVILPWSHDRVGDPHFEPKGQVYQEGVKNLPGLAQESRSGDANGQWARVLAGNGVFTYLLQTLNEQQRFGLTNLQLQGANPPKSPEPPYRYDVPCETQQTPNLNTKVADPLPLLQSTNIVPIRAQVLGEAMLLEGAAQLIAGLGKGGRKRAQEFLTRAAQLRARHNLEGKTFGKKGKSVSIVQSKMPAAATAELAKTLGVKYQDSPAKEGEPERKKRKGKDEPPKDKGAGGIVDDVVDGVADAAEGAKP